MKSNFRLYILLFLALISVQLNAQEFQVPQNYSLKYSTDYAFYEKDVIRCVDWLEKTAVDQQKEKHEQVYVFLFAWTEGAHNVHVNIDEQIMGSKCVKTMALLIPFMGGWSRYELAHPDKPDQVQEYLAGLRCMFKVYQNGSLKKDKDLEQKIEMDKNGQLENWVADNLPKVKN